MTKTVVESHMNKFTGFISTHRDRVIPGVLLLLSCLMYLTLLNLPPSMFWDENYHIASAQKHVDGVMYMEPHPPLGKMLMGLSEATFGLNKDRDMEELLKTDYLKGEKMPKGMEFFGFRFPSAFMMAASVFFLYGIVFNLTRSRWVGVTFALFLIFDNALVVHSRGAMLEGIQMFFIMGALWYLSRMARDDNKTSLKSYAILGLFVGLSVAVKVNGLILALLLLIMFWEENLPKLKDKQWLQAIERLVFSGLTFFAVVASVMLVVMYLHIGMGSEVIKGRTYKASPEYLKSMKDNGTWSFTTYRLGLKDHYRYHAEYADGVPRLDICKDGENGSPWFQWPFGGKAINYRWSKNVVDGVATVHYSYLAGNPLVWLGVVVGVLFSVSLIIGRYVYDAPIKDHKLFMWITYFTGLYLSYMIAIAQIQRVMYLYHYFVPLMFGIINLSLVFKYIFKNSIEEGTLHTRLNMVAIMFMLISFFAWFSPMTFGFGIGESQFDLRNWFSVWDMEAVK